MNECLSDEQERAVSKRIRELTHHDDDECGKISLNMSSGSHNLSEHSRIRLYRKYVSVSREEFQKLYKFMEDDVDSTPNPMNTKTFLKRKQCTFVTPGTSSYEFGQYNQTFRSEIEEWPMVVQNALRETKTLASTLGVAEDVYNGVHVNLYRDGSVGVLPHSDKEHSMLRGMPIFSFTLLSDDALPRPFSIYSRDKVKLHDINLGNGDLLIMEGRMQEEFYHGVEPAKPPKQYKNLVRINMTVRAFRSTDA